MIFPSDSLRRAPDALASIRSYHERSKHTRQRYAAGPDTLDWDAQPNPFRTFAGAARIDLPAPGRALATPFGALFAAPPDAPGALQVEAVTLDTLALLLELALGLSAWKQSGPDRWAVRCNPSSGNLHPTEAYLLCVQVPGIGDGVYHYDSRAHALEQRCRSAPPAHEAGPAVHIALSSIHWREAWKYGERAFRYCQLDCGHAIGALRYAAAALGWSLRLDEQIGTERLASLLGLDRGADFAGAEREEAELLLTLAPNGAPGAADGVPAAPCLPDSVNGVWSGRANVLDAHPMFRWPVIGEVARASRQPAGAGAIGAIGAADWRSARSAATTDGAAPAREPSAWPAGPSAAALIRQRRSAQYFDRRATLGQAEFFRMLDALLPCSNGPWAADGEARIHALLFVHRVDGLAPGLYALPRSAGGERQLRAALHPGFAWSHVDEAAHLPLYLLHRQDLGAVARALNCAQAIAADGAFAVAMLAEFDAVIGPAPWRYRRLFWEAGLVGQVLYLAAEAACRRGTGIGCFIDDDCHTLLGLADRTFQSLYHFTVGTPQIDARIASLPPYPAPDSATDSAPDEPDATPPTTESAMPRSRSFQRVSAAEAEALLSRPELRVLDARDVQSHAAGHIAGATYFGSAELDLAVFDKNKRQPVLLYCYHGNASQIHAQTLADFGYAEVYELIGGYEAWRAHVGRPRRARD